MSRFVPDRGGIRELARTPEVREWLDDLGEQAKTAVERETPIGVTGDAISSYRVRRLPTAVRLSSTDFAFHLIEFGSVNNPAYAPMRRGITRLGLTFRPADKA